MSANASKGYERGEDQALGCHEMPSARPRAKRGFKPLGDPTPSGRECRRQIEAQSATTRIRQVIFRRVGNLIRVSRITRQHRHSAPGLQAFRFDNEKLLGFAHAAFLAGRGANEPFAQERASISDRIRSLVGTFETNSRMQLPPQPRSQ
jgi:hypothetical protein